MAPIGLLAIAASQQWTLVCGGDIMLNGLTPSADRLAAAVPLLRRANVAMANLEVPLTDTKARTPGKSAKEVKARTQFVLKADPKHAALLPKWGFKVLTEGNNHAMDYRWSGLSQELGLLDKNGILHTGAGEDWKSAWAPVQVPLCDSFDLSIGAALAFAGDQGARKCTPAKADAPGVAVLFLNGEEGKKELKEKIDKMRKGSGPVILFLHWGTERATLPRDYQVALGRACIDAGADAVLGAHPHVLQGGELYKGKPILYSLGNLISPLSCDIALAELKFDGRNFVSFKLHPFRNDDGVLRRYNWSEFNRAQSGFADLCDQIQDQFPNKDSAPLKTLGVAHRIRTRVRSWRFARRRNEPPRARLASTDH